MSDDSSSEPQRAFVVAAAVLLGLPFIVSLGIAGLVLATGAGLMPGRNDAVTGETGWNLVLFFSAWGIVAVAAVLIFVVRYLRRSPDS